MEWAGTSLGRNNFDFLRFALACLVIFSHSYPLTTGLESTEPLMRLTHGQISFGTLAVDWFFVISGFLITHSWMRSRGTWDFVSKRARRIYPGFIVAMLFCALVAAPLGLEHPQDAFSAWSLVALIPRTLILHGYNHNQAFAGNPWPGAINSSVWSIPYECWCYAGVAVLGCMVLLRQRLILTLFLTSVVLGFGCLFCGYTSEKAFLWKIVGYPAIWAKLLPYYLAGMVFYLYRDLIPYSRWLVASALAALIIGAIAPQGLAIALPTAGTYLLFCFAFQPAGRLADWARNGDFSYGIYLYAFPVQQLLVRWLPHLTPLQLFGLALPASIALGNASWHGVEKWFLGARRRRAPADPAGCLEVRSATSAPTSNAAQ